MKFNFQVHLIVTKSSGLLPKSGFISRRRKFTKLLGRKLHRVEGRLRVRKRKKKGEERWKEGLNKIKNTVWIRMNCNI